MLEINQKSLTVPLIQGGMGVGVSLGSLAGHVAKCGAMGVISTAHPGYKEDDFESNHRQANIRALKKEILKAQKFSQGKGLVAINAMVALKDYDDVEFTKNEFKGLWEQSTSILPADIQQFKQKTHIGQEFTPYELYLKFLGLSPVSYRFLLDFKTVRFRSFSKDIEKNLTYYHVKLNKD